jgi:hypothetical protein
MLLANIQQQMQEVNTQTPTSNEEIMAQFLSRLDPDKRAQLTQQILAMEQQQQQNGVAQ